MAADSRINKCAEGESVSLLANTPLAECGTKIVSLPAEDDDGHVEYKRHLVNPTAKRLSHLTTQLKFRLSEGKGEAFYEIGVDDNGFPRGLSEDELKLSLETLEKMAASLSCKTLVVSIRDGHEGKVAEILVRNVADDAYVDLKVAVVGNVDAGKSTFIGVLTRGALDNGRGASRLYVFTHRHEIETGRTSAVSHQVMGFDADGKVVNYDKIHSEISDVIAESKKLVTFIDLAGHEKYLKTTCRGMSGNALDYAMIIVAANNGLTKMSKEHIGIALALKVPLVFVVTKIDIAPKNVLDQTMNDISRILKLPGVRKMPVVIRTMDDVVTVSKSFQAADRLAPIFLVSNVTGEGLDLVRSFLNFAPRRIDWSEMSQMPFAADVDDSFNVEGVGCVVSALVTHGSVQVGDSVCIGPDANGSFVRTEVKSIQSHRVSVHRVHAGMSAAFALRKVKRSFVRNGMVLVPESEARAVWEFEADVLILHSHATSIHQGYQPVVHVRAVRQTVKLTELNSEIVRTGDRARVRFRFMFRPEVVRVGERLIFREGRTKGMGVITHINKVAEPINLFINADKIVEDKKEKKHHHDHEARDRLRTEKERAYKLKR
eukprot:ANDGO_05548.mRNA.1 GTP-binding protein AGP-1